MYERFFGLSKSPFAMTPDPSSILLTEGHREALAGLSYALLRRKGFVVLVAEAGLGKTTLLRRLAEIVPESAAHTSVVFNPLLSPAEFLELLLLKFGLDSLPDSKAARLILLENLLNHAYQSGRVPVLIVDEAHKLSPEVLEEIRLLTNFETSDHKMLQIVLAGQPELARILNRPELGQLKQRVAVRLQLGPLSRKHVGEYIDFRWKRAGGAAPAPFDGQARDEIACASKGVPRVVNAICDNALLIACARQSATVIAGDVLEVLRDLDIQEVHARASAANPQSPQGARTAPLRPPPPAPAPLPVPVRGPDTKEQRETHTGAGRATALLDRWVTRIRA
jgi:general secretion pathway protein A